MENMKMYIFSFCIITKLLKSQKVFSPQWMYFKCNYEDILLSIIWL